MNSLQLIQPKLDNVLTKGTLAERIKKEKVESIALEILLFADNGQDVSSILEKHLFKYETEKMDIRRLKTLAAIEVLEQALGIKFGKNDDDDKTIIKTFMERRIRRSYHGTCKAAAKAILQNGISFDPKVKGYDYNEFEKLFDECGLEKKHWPFALNKDRDDSSKFYVSYDVYKGIYYSRYISPEWFLRFQEWGSNEQKDLDVDKLRRITIENNPKVVDVERVVKFVQDHWERCGSKKKTVAVLIVEQDKDDPGLFHNCDAFNGDVMKVYEYFKVDKGSDVKLEKLITAMERIPNFQGIDERLSVNNTKKPPKVIRAVKIVNK